MAKRRLLRQLFAVYCGASVVVMAFLALYAGYAARNLYLDRVAGDLETDARFVEQRVVELLAEGSTERIQPVAMELGNSLRVRVTVIEPSGKVYGDSREDPTHMDNHRDRPEIAVALSGSVGRFVRHSDTLKEERMYIAVPILHGGKTLGVARTSVSVQGLAETLTAVYWRIAAATAVMIGLLAGASYWASRRILRPLQHIRAGALQLARGDLQHRLPMAATEEFTDLAKSLNAMAEQLDARIRTIICKQNEHEAMLSSMEEGVLAVDQSGTIISLNENCARLLGVVPEKVRGRLIHGVIRKADLLRIVDSALESDVPVDGELELFDDRGLRLHATGTVLRDAERKKIGALVVLYDVTRLRQLENVRRDFVANVSHELRTPITSIKGFVETLVDGEVDNRDNAMRFLRIILRQVNRLDAIIEDLLSLSRLERVAEGQNIPVETAKLLDVLRGAAEMCEMKAAEKQITLDVQCPQDLAAEINAPLLEQAVVNLVDNAIKYSDAGSTVHVEADRDNGGVVLRVRDQGCGIESAHLPRLFERFYRVDKARSRELGGTGLGLAIVKHIVMAHRGSVEVQSTVGKGSTFSIHLPKHTGDGTH